VSEERWTEIDRYMAGLLVPPDPALDAALVASEALPGHAVSPLEGKLLHLLAAATGARAILEIGTLCGYSTIWLARALPADGRLVTLEAVPEYVRQARENIERAGLAALVEVIAGPAVETLPELSGPYDLIFIDADKRSNPEYLAEALRLSRPGTVIVADNVVRDGAVADPESDDESAQGVRRFFELVAAEPRLRATAIQTVGSKGHDGFALAIVVG